MSVVKDDPCFLWFGPAKMNIAGLGAVIPSPKLLASLCCVLCLVV